MIGSLSKDETSGEGNHAISFFVIMNTTVIWRILIGIYPVIYTLGESSVWLFSQALENEVRHSDLHIVGPNAAHAANPPQ